MPNENFSGKTDLEYGLFFCCEKTVFELVIFQFFLSNPYTIMCVSTIGSLSLFGRILKIIVKRKSNLGFSGPPPTHTHILDFSAYFNYSIYRGEHSGVGDHSQVPEVLE